MANMNISSLISRNRGNLCFRSLNSWHKKFTGQQGQEGTRTLGTKCNFVTTPTLLKMSLSCSRLGSRQRRSLNRRVPAELQRNHVLVPTESVREGRGLYLTTHRIRTLIRGYPSASRCLFSSGSDIPRLAEIK